MEKEMQNPDIVEFVICCPDSNVFDLPCETESSLF